MLVGSNRNNTINHRKSNISGRFNRKQHFSKTPISNADMGVRLESGFINMVSWAITPLVGWRAQRIAACGNVLRVLDLEHLWVD